MRAVIIGTDFMKDTDGTFKALETNTNIQLDTQWSLNFDSTSFENFVLSNNFTEVVLITNENQLSHESSHTFNYELEEIRSIIKTNRENGLPNVDFNISFNSFLESFLSGNSIQLTTITTDTTSTTIPFIEDSVNKLIIRLSFDTTALIDDSYARDNWGFLKLMYDADNNSIPKCFINDSEFGIDSIGNTLRDNGNHPNYCIKKRVTPSDNKKYPILYKIDTIEELNTLKSNLEVDEYIQEYIYNTNDLLDNRLKAYRSVDLVYGPNLDIINLQIIEKTKNLPIVASADFDDNKQVQPWDRMRYLQKFYTSINEIAIKSDASENTKVILPDNSLELAPNLQLGDGVKSIMVPNLPDESITGNLDFWSTSFDSVMSGDEVQTSFLDNKSSSDFFGVLVTIETATNSTFSDVGHAKIMVKDGNTVKFERYSSLEIGDEILIYDTTTDELILTTVTELNFRFDRFTALTLDFENLDIFLTVEETENQSRYGLVTLNYDYDCTQSDCANTGGPGASFYYQACSSGGLLVTYAWTGRTPQVCAKRYYGAWIGQSCYGGTVRRGVFCNNQKSDIQYKENINLIGVSDNGLNIYEFNYKNSEGRYQGVIAQELIGTKYEESLIKNYEGLYEVDYNKLDVEFKKLN